MPEPNRPKLRNSNQVSSPQRHQGKSQKPSKKQNKEEKKPLLPRLENSAEVPVMFRAQIEEAHGSLQFAGNVEGREKKEDIANDWVQEWLEPWQFSDSSMKAAEKPKPKPSAPSSKAIQRPPQSKPQKSGSTEANYELKMPTWDSQVGVWTYEISWRLVTNSGQEPDFIRPVFGAKGVPFYPGSSMKGAFAKACGDAAAGKNKRSTYCGQESTENEGTKPGLLRFHGGYPVDKTWADQKTLVDVIHPQQNRQVETEVTTGAKKQISLYRTAICFRISSTDPDKTDWAEVQAIWEKALMSGLGGRTSAGYGKVACRIEGKQKIPLTETRETILSVHLSGQGITSQLLNKKPEFRPNMFKAALRGHTLRLFSGISDGDTAKLATSQLWGGIKEKAGNSEEAATVGQFGIQFTTKDDHLKDDLKHKYKSYDTKLKQWRYPEMSMYRLQSGRLDILHQTTQNSVPEIELKHLAKNLIRFTLLLGGFGKSWRRVDHQKFSHQTYLKDYFANGDKPTIGCHWEFGQESYSLYLDTSDWENTIRTFLNDLQKQVSDWLVKQRFTINGYEKTWRESWHPENVQVWGRLANGEQDSLAIAWFHQDYTNAQSIKGTFAGKMGKIGRVWHRMYPQYVQVNGKWQATGKYVELLTIFPRFENVSDPDKKDAEKFVQFLQSSQDFTKLWGN